MNPSDAPDADPAPAAHTLRAPVRLMAGGDVMLGRQMPGWVALRGAADPLSGLAGLFRSADLALVNLEICVSTEGDMINKGGRQPYYYHAHPEMLEVLVQAGVNTLATANNHAMDFGAEALTQQITVLDDCGFAHFGAGRTLAEAASPRDVNVGGVVIALIGVETETPVMAATESSAGIHHVPVDRLAQVLAEPIALARQRADLVLVSPHWGANWLQAPSKGVRAAAHALIALGADAVLGHSAHVLQGVEFHLGRPIVYDMGSLLFDRVTQNNMRDSALFELLWTPDGRCELLIRPVKLSTARARRAKGADFARICEAMSGMTLALNPSQTIDQTDQGLHLQDTPVPSAKHQRTGAVAQLAPLGAPQVPERWRMQRSNLVYDTLRGLPGLWDKPLRLNQSITVLGARFAHPVRAERGFVCEVYFRATAPEGVTRIEARVAALASDGSEVFAYIHPVAEGIHPPARWRWHEVICDRVCVRPVKAVPDGVYRLCWSLVDLHRGEPLPVEGDDDRLFHGHVCLGEFTVSGQASAAVVGIAAQPLMPRTLPPAAPQPLDWHAGVTDLWNQQAHPWVTQALASHGLTLTSPTPAVVRDEALSLVLRLDTSGGDYYFKALGAQNFFEPALVAHLSQHWADRIAVPLATDAARGWMLTADHGRSVRQSVQWVDQALALQDAAARLAELQIGTCEQVDELLALGVPDRRLGHLPGFFEQLLHNPQALKLAQPDGLSPQEQDQALALLPRLGEVCEELLTQPCAAALDHGDLHLDNLLVKADKVVLFDWDTAWVTHPFCSLLLSYNSKSMGGAQGLAGLLPLAEAYLKPWAVHLACPVAELLPRLYQALWVAHAKRALFWSDHPRAELENGRVVPNRTLKWVRLWLQRAPLLLQTSSVKPESDPSFVPGATTKPVAEQPAARPSVQPPKLATPANPLLLDAALIASLTGGTWTNAAKTQAFSGMSFKRAYLAEGTSGNLYFAINHDARHQFKATEVMGMARGALDAGAAAVVVPREIQGLPDDWPLLRVPGDVDALQVLGEHVRDHLFTGRRVLVSGTEGKTGFKNMLHHVLSPQISTHAMTNSSNLGFSIMASLASIRKNDRIAIVEAAGTHPGRLAARSGYVKPHLFVLTEVGNEHINFHGSQQAVIESKADIAVSLMPGGFGILNADSRNYAATRRAVLARKRVPLCVFGSERLCNGRLVSRDFQNNAWVVSAEIEGQPVRYRLPLLGDHAPLASVSVLLAAYYLGAEVGQAAAEFETFRPYESQGRLRQLSHRGGVITCYDNASRASMLSYQSTLSMAARLTPPNPRGKKVAVIGQMIFLGDESAAGHAQLAQWVDAAGFDRIILVGKYTDVTFAHLKHPGVVVARFSEYDRRTSSKADLQSLIDATEAACNPGDLLFIKGEVDELGQYLRTKELLDPDRHPRPRTEGTTSAPIEPRRALETGGFGERAGEPALTPAPRPASSATPDPSALDDLRPLKLDDLARYRRAIDATQRITWQHYFPFIYFLGQSPGNRFLIAEDDDSVCIYLLRDRKDGPDLNLFVLPMPMNAAVLERCIARVKAFNRAERASLFRVDAEDVKPFRTRANTRVVACPQEYIYAPANYLDLSGGKAGKLRREINTILKHGDIEVVDYQTAFAPECKQVLNRWAAIQREKYGGVQYEGFTAACMEGYDLFPRADLFGKVLRLNGQICSFGFGGEMRQGLGNIFIVYSDMQLHGLSRFMNYTLLLNMQHLALANASHAGDTPGLAAAKQAMLPVFLAQPHQVYAG